jgi:hypothetical protein
MPETINSANAAASTLFLGQNGEWWDFWLIVSVVLAALAAVTIGITTTGSVVSHKREASAAEKELQKYKLDTAKEISEANARTKEAELKLAEVREKLGRPRRLDNEALLASLKNVPPVPVEITLVTTDPDSHWIASSILGALEKMGWPVLPSGGLEIFRQTPPLLKMCAGNFGGISVLSKNISKEESGYLTTSPKPQRPDKPFLALWDALWKAVGANEVALATCPFVPEGQLHIVVAPRWVIFPQEPPTSAAPADPADTAK